MESSLDFPLAQCTAIKGVTVRTFITAVFIGLFSVAAFAANYELQRSDSSAPGGYVTVSTHSTNAECAKAAKAARERDPKGDYGCRKTG
jgi:hypothetical protein